MIRSMTGYARHEARFEDCVLTWEARSVNHRYLEVTVRLPEELRGIEPACRARAGERLGRGKVELGLRVARDSGVPAALTVNDALIDRLTDAARRVAGRARCSPDLRVTDLLRWPGVIDSPPPDTDALARTAREALDVVLDGLVETRRSEGERLATLLTTRCDAIAGHAARVRAHMPQLRTAVLERLRERVTRLGVDADPGRLEQELALAATRMDVDEELDRLDAHIAEIASALGREEPVGRRLDFLIQELNREANTLGSKAADTEVSHSAVELKVLIEQMREQVQNVE